MDYSEIPSLLLLTISILVCLIGGMLSNMYSKNYIFSIKDRLLFCIIMQSFAAITLFALSGFTIKCSAYTVILAVSFGAITVINLLSNLSALAIGPWSYTAVIGSFSTVITAFSGYLFWHEKLSVIKIFCIFLMVICICLATANGGDEKKVSFRWLLFALLSSLSTASVGILQKVHQNSAYKDELSQFLVIAFISSLLLSTVAYFISNCLKKSENTNGEFKKRILDKKILFLGMALIGIFTALNNEFNLYLVGVIDSAVFFPLVNGGGLILSVLMSVLIFKEKLSRKQSIGILLGIVATLFLCR